MMGNVGDTLSVAGVCSLVSWWSEPPRDKLLKLLCVLYDHDHPRIEDEDEERPVKDVLDPLLQLPLVPSHWVSWTDLRRNMMTMKIERTMLRRRMKRIRQRRRMNELITSAKEQQPLSPLPIYEKSILSYSSL